MLKRVVITGMDCITPLGNSLTESWSNLLSGTEVLQPITNLKGTDHLPKTLKMGQLPQQSNELKQIANKFLDSKDERRLTPAMKLALLTTQRAIKNCNWDEKTINKNRISVTCGIGLPAIEEMFNASIQFKSKNKISPLFIPQILPNMLSSILAIKFGIKGPLKSISGACATGNNALIEGYNNIKLGQSDISIVNATECSLHPIAISGFHKLKTLSLSGISKPFDQSRDGFVIGEGSGTIILEEYEHAKKRNANIWAELKGYGQSNDSYHMIQPRSDSEGVINALNSCLENSNVDANEIDYINAHATSTSVGDLAELKGIEKALLAKNRDKNLYINSNKGAMGHLLGAAGIVESIFTILSMKNNIIPHTLNLKNPIQMDSDKLIYVKNKPLNTAINLAMCNSFGFGGINTCILFSK